MSHDQHSKTNDSKLKTHQCLLTAVTIAAGTNAYGAAVRFDNDGSFDWYFNTLDLTQPVTNQMFGDITGSSIYLDYFSDFYPAFSYQHSYTRGGGAEIWNSGFSNRYAAPLAAGELVGPGLEGGVFSEFSTLEFAFQQGDPYYYYYYYYRGGDNGYRGLIPADGSPSYIGTRLTIDGATHYGWISLANNSGFIEVFAWGYETQAGVPVPAGIPTPGAMGLLAIGAVGALGRKKRA